MFDIGTHSERYGGIPSGLADMEPSPFLATILLSIDMDELTGGDRVEVLRARQKMASHFQAGVYVDMASITDAMVDLGEESEAAPNVAASEVRAALRLTRQSADVSMQFAMDLRDGVPRVLDAFRSGRIDIHRARILADSTSHLPEAARNAVVDEVIEDAPKLTTGQLRARVRRLCLAIQPDEAERRYESALEQRRVVAELTEEGTCNLLGMDLAPHHVAMAYRRINKLARSLAGENELRTMDQRRADVIVDLLLGEPGDGDGAVVHITADIETLAKVAEHPGELNGYGPVISDIARQVAEEQERAEFRYSVTDPNSGMPIYVGTTSRRPTANMRRRIHARDATCVFPGCRVPAVDCDIDHIDQWSQGGATSEGNNAPLCESDHSVKDTSRWTYRRLKDGDYLWSSPLGRVYTTSGQEHRA